MIRYHEGIFNTFNFNIDTKVTHTKVEDRKTDKYKRKICNDIFTFDIEVTSAWLEDGHVIGYRKHMPEEYWNSLEPVSLCYIWMFGVNDTVIYGRELEEFYKLLNELPEMQAVIYIHSLAYEFCFLSNILKWKSVFAKLPHKPMKCVPSEFPLIEFRCSYMLENLSLEKWGKEIGVNKKSGDLDYLKVRTPLTKLDKKEFGYCEYDIRVLYAGIKKEVERYGSLYDIPLTSTGKIRRVVKDIMYNIPDFNRYIKRLVPSLPIYVLLRQVFAGGYTHPSRLYAGQVIRGITEHRDFASSYPFCICACLYPCTPFTYRTDRYIPKDKSFEKWAFILKLHFEKIESTAINTYIQKSKCYNISGAVKDNGRIVYADSLDITITEIDWLIIKSHYKWESVTLIDSWYAKKDYLPKPFIEYVLKLYGDKTSLKDVEGMEDIYNLSKTFINACYGMMCSNIVQSDVKIDSAGNWYIEPLQPETVDRKLKALSNRYHTRDKRYFLNYAWGCWVTAYARYNLWKCMDLCTDNPEIPGKDVLYVDTDSIYGKGIHDYSSYDNWAVEQLEKMCKHYKIDPELTRPKNPDGKTCQLGVFEDEGDNITEFCTLHAKCYVFRGKKKKDKQPRLYLTVAGINKDAVDVLQDDIENFEKGLVFDKDHESVKKNMHTYITDQGTVTWPDGYVSTCTSGINIRPTGYTIKGSDEYDRLLEAVQNLYIDDITDITINKLKGYFEIDGEETIL